ncbi:MAG: hypothetical protein AAF823_12805 [Planctomycetota bacterium]
MADIEIGPEVESDVGWSYEVSVYSEGKAHRYDVTLSYADYDLWSKGSVAPSRVVRRAFEFLLEREPASMILSKFDCSVIRRYFPEVDTVLPAGAKGELE